MFILKIFKFLFKAILRVVLFFVQIILTVLAIVVGICGGYAELIGGIIGGLLILGSLLCIATGQVDGSIFVQMFLTGVAFSAIPAAIKALGEEGIYALKDALYDCVN